MSNSDNAEIILSAEEEKRAEELHQHSVVILAHDHLYGADDLSAMRRGGVTAKVVKLTVDGIEWDEQGRRVPIEEYEGWIQRGLTAMDAVHRLAEERTDEVVIVRSVADILAAKRDGKVGLILSFEGPRPLEASLAMLRTYHRLGLRDLQFTWAAPNQLITDGCLNDLGVEVVREMDRLGIVIDLSHLSDAAFWQVLEITRRPVIMSHTACYAVSGPGDTLTDEKIRAIADKGGIIALHFVSGDYIKPRRGTQQALLDDLVDHVDHLRSLVGIDCVALGGDYFPTVPEDNWAWVKGLDDISRMPNATRALIKRGYSDEEIEKILGGNLLRLFQEVWRR